MIGSVFDSLQMNPLRDCYFRTHQTSRRHTKCFTRTCYLWLNNASHLAIAGTMCHVGTITARCFIAPSSEPQWGPTLIERLRPSFLGSNRISRSDGKKLSIPLTSRTLATRRGAPSINLLTGLDGRIDCAPHQQTPSPHNLQLTGHTRPGTASPSGSRKETAV